MSITLLVCVAVSGWATPEKQAELRRLRSDAIVHRALERWQLRQVESDAAFDRDMRIRVRRRTAYLEQEIKLLEWQLGEFAESFPPEFLQSLQQDLERTRADLPRWQKYQQALDWAEQQRRLNPGLKTERMIQERLFQAYEGLWPKPVAPMPRLVKPRVP